MKKGNKGGFWDYEYIVEETEKGSNIVKFSLAAKDGKQFISIREWYTDKEGNERPTRKGLTIPVDLIDDYTAAIDACVDALDHMETKKKELEDGSINLEEVN